MKDGFLILKPVRKVREGWNNAFKKMAQNGDDTFDDENME